MSKISRFITFSIVTLMFFSIVALAADFSLVLSADAGLTRFFGNDRYGTAVEVSREGWENGASVVVLARGDVYADALAGVPLAHANDAPVLLTTPTRLPAVTKDEIIRLGAGKVYLLGGPSAISPEVGNELKAMDLEVVRIQGNNRFDTAARIAMELAPDGGDTVFLAFGLNFPDALSAAAYAANFGAPILLTLTDELPAETRAALEALNPQQIFVIGGPAVISDRVMEMLPGARRLSGPDRFETSAALAQWFAPGKEVFFIATGNNASGGADAITGAALAARRGTGVLLVGDSLPDSISQFLGRGVQDAYLLGGQSAISASVGRAIAAALYVPQYTPPPKPPKPTDTPVTEIRVKPCMVLEVGQVATIEVEVLPANATNKELEWSLPYGCVSIDENGRITALEGGIDNIWVSSVSNPEIEASIKIIVGDLVVQEGGNIQAAIDEAEEGDVVALAPGEYDLDKSRIVISKAICLCGAGYDQTTIKGTVHRDPTDDGFVQPMLLTIPMSDSDTYIYGIRFHWVDDPDIGENSNSALSLAGNNVVVSECKVTTDISADNDITLVNIGKSGGSVAGEAGVAAQKIDLEYSVVEGSVSIVQSTSGIPMAASVSENTITAVNMEGIWTRDLSESDDLWIQGNTISVPPGVDYEIKLVGRVRQVNWDHYYTVATISGANNGARVLLVD